MRNIAILCSSFLFLIVLSLFVSASTPALRIVSTEYVGEVLAYDQTLGETNDPTEARFELGENRTGKSRTNVALSDVVVSGYLNISNVETIGSQTLVSLNITMNGTENINRIFLDTAPPGNYIVYNISTGENPVNSPNISIFIAELRAGHSAIFQFNFSGNGLGEPLNFTENYTYWKVMTGESTHIFVNATNSFPDPVTLYDVEFTKTPEQYNSTLGPGVYAYFNYTNLTGQDAASAVLYTDGYGRSILSWNASGGDLAPGETAQIRFDAWAPQNISIPWNDSADWATWMRMGNLSASFKFNGSMTGIRIINVTSVSPASRLSVRKDRWNETHWNGTVNISNDAVAALDYDLQKVSIWATQYQQYTDPGNTATWIQNTNLTAYGFGFLPGTQYANATWWPRINLSNGTFNDSHSILFNYSLIPIIWATADFRILDDGTQIFTLNQSQTLENGYLFIEEIYVLLGGYLVKATKQLTPIDQVGVRNRYIVNITIENVGTEKTPGWISMFDLIPKGFWPRVFAGGGAAQSLDINMTNENEITITNSLGGWDFLGTTDTIWGSADTGYISGGEYDGYWGYHIDFRALDATSNGDGYYDSSDPTTEIGIAYYIQGNSTISSIENAYIIGVDPIRLEGANPSRTVASKLAAQSSSWEYVVLISSLSISLSVLAVGIKYIHSGGRKRRKRK
jgi:hypothetical protein